MLRYLPTLIYALLFAVAGMSFYIGLAATPGWVRYPLVVVYCMAFLTLSGWLAMTERQHA